MRGFSNKRRLLRVSLIELILAASVLLCAWGYNTYRAHRKEQELIPRQQIAYVERGLRSYRQRTKRFPPSLVEIDRVIWRNHPTPEYGTHGQTMSLSNYYYIHSPIDRDHATLWVIPLGPRAAAAPTHFMRFSPTITEHWKGPALPKEKASLCLARPSDEHLARMDMVLHQTLDLTTTTKNTNPWGL